MATNDNDHGATCPKWPYQVVFVHFGLTQILSTSNMTRSTIHSDKIKHYQLHMDCVMPTMVWLIYVPWSILWLATCYVCMILIIENVALCTYVPSVYILFSSFHLNLCDKKVTFLCLQLCNHCQILPQIEWRCKIHKCDAMIFEQTPCSLVCS